MDVVTAHEVIGQRTSSCGVILLLSLSWLQINSQFVRQPGDVALAGIPGYPISVGVPCILDKHYEEVAWEQKIGEHSSETISDYRTIYPPYQSIYEVTQGDKWDFSIFIKRVPPSKPQVRCYIKHLHLDVSYSSWSNITYMSAVPPRNMNCSAEPHTNPIIEGENISLTCTSGGAVPAATLKFFNETSNKLLPRSKQGNGKVSTTITASRYDNETLFYCMAEHPATGILWRTPNCSVVFEVISPPMNTVCSVEPDPNELIEGETMSIACKSEGAFPPATLKLFNGTSRKLLTEGGQDTGKVSTTIAVSRHDNERLFYCTAENAATTILARTPKCLVVVQVLYRPYITNFSIATYPTEVDLGCEVDSNPHSNIIVIANTTDGSSRVLAEQPGGTELRYTMATANCSSIVSLKCLATNVIGTTERTVSLIDECHQKELNDGKKVENKEKQVPDVTAMIESNRTLIFIITGVVFIFLLLLILPIIGWICHQRRNSPTQTASTGRAEMNCEGEEVALTALDGRELATDEYLQTTAIDSNSGNSHSDAGSSEYEMPRPLYINQQMQKPVYTHIESESNDERVSSSQDVDYEEVEDVGHETPTITTTNNR